MMAKPFATLENIEEEDVFADDATVQRLRQQASRPRSTRRSTVIKLVDVLLDEPHPLFAHPPNMSSPNSSLPNLDMNRGASNASSVQGGQTNGNGNGSASNYVSPLPAGHQQDLNFLYGQIQDLSAVLAANREKTAQLTKVAKEVQRRGLVPDMDDLKLGEENGDSADTEKQKIKQLETRVLDLEQESKKKDSLINAYKHEQKENTSLLADYEDAVGTMTEQIRNYCLGIDGRFLGQKRHYNNLLQQEKDEHLNTRLERDEWYTKTLRCAGMIRTAKSLRDDEWYEEYAVIAGLQGEVRCMRRVLQWEKQKPEEEGGWPYLKDLPFDDVGEI